MKSSSLCAAFLAVSLLQAAAWQSNQSPDLILGTVPDPAHLSYTTDMVVDPVSGKLFVSDGQGGRVFRYSAAMKLVTGAIPEAVFGKPSMADPANSTYSATNMIGPGGLALDSAGRLWVGDGSRILRWDSALTRGSGEPADGVLGGADFTTVYPPSDPSSLSAIGLIRLAVDAAGNLYASCSGRNCILRFDNAAAKPNGAPADAVFGQSNFTNTTSALSSNRLNSPGDITVRNNTLWVLDAGNSRILRLDNAAARATYPAFDAVLGQTSLFSGSSSMLSKASAMEISAGGTLYIGSQVLNPSFGNIQTWTGVDALSGLLPSPTASAETSFNFTRMALDQGMRLWTGGGPVNSPVRRLDNFPSTVVSGTLGAAKLPAIVAAGQVVVDPVSRKVFVSDRSANVIRRFPSMDAIGTGALPEAVFYGFAAPYGMCMDHAGHLFVADTNAGRVVRYNDAANIPSGAPASGSLGVLARDYSNEASMNGPTGVAIDAAGTLWVSDYPAARVLRFDHAASKSGEVPADGILGQMDFTTFAASNRDWQFYRPAFIQLDAAGNLWVLDIIAVADPNSPPVTTSGFRLMRFSDPTHKPAGAVADAIIRIPSNADHYYQIAGLAVTPDNTLWIAGLTSSAVLFVDRYDNATSLASGLIPAPSGNVDATRLKSTGVLNPARSLATDPDGNLWLSSYGVCRYRKQPVTDIPGFIIAAFGAPAVSFQLTYTAIPGSNYFVESTADFNTWSLLEVRQASSPRETFSAAPSAGAKQFYRVGQFPPGP